jgi:hypothetical protein
MTLDGFLTFLALIIAAYSVASSATRLRLRLRLASLSFISITCFILVIYYEMFADNGFGCPASFGILCRSLVLNETKFPTAGEVSFIIVLLWLSVALFTITRRGVSVGALPSLRRLVDELLYGRRHAEVVEVVEPVLPLLSLAAARQLRTARLYDRLRIWRRSGTAMEIVRSGLSEPDDQATSLQNLFSAMKFGVGKVGQILPDGARAEESAKEILRVLLLRRDMLEFVAQYRPAFAVKLLALKVNEVEQFSSEYLTTLISTPHSTLYAEAKNNQNYKGATSQFVFPEENKLLHFLFADAKQAERLSVWQPLGDWVIARLRSERYQDYARSLNEPSADFEDGCWEDPTFVVIHFFNLMVSAAEYQDVCWHMWLYYFQGIL